MIGTRPWLAKGGGWTIASHVARMDRVAFAMVVQMESETRKVVIPWWFTLGCLVLLGFGIFLAASSLVHRHWFTLAFGLLLVALAVMWNRILGPSLFSELRGKPRTPRGGSS